jgi:MtN3 and saliva related transmembrane protein
VNSTDILGYTAAFLTTFAMLPQALHVYRTQEVEQLSARTFGMATFGSVLWIAYGIVISNTVILLANLIGLCLVGYILWKKVRG